MRGASGGYRLARSPEAISLADIINPIDGGDRTPGKGDRLQATPAVEAIRGIWSEVHAAQQQILEETTLAVLVRQVQTGDDFAYVI